MNVELNSKSSAVKGRLEQLMYEDRQEPQIVFVERFVHGGYGIGKLPGGKLVLVEGGYPSELVKITITQERNDVAFGKVVEILEPAKFRRVPRCKYFGTCGGCHLMDIDYNTQLALKKEVIQDQLKRIAKVETEVKDTIPSDLEYGYRSKMEFAFGFKDGKVLLGLKRRNSSEVVSINECPISPNSFNKALAVVPEIVETTKVKIYNPLRRTGTLKHLVLRFSHSHNQTMAIFVTKTETFREARDIRALLLRKVPQINSIIHAMNSSDTVVLRGPYKTLYGSGVLEVEMDYEKFQIPPTAFFQINHHITNKMIEHVVKGLQLEGNEVVLDLYAGIGTFTIRLAMLSKFVTAVESSHISVKAGRANANINSLRNVKFEEADVEEFLKSCDSFVDIVVLDPPRTGAGKTVCQKLLELKPRKIAYISCDPATLARDLAILKELYEIESVQPFDMFPQTYHVETVVLLKRGG